ncbi:hypothetical protein AGMMS50267_14950 [Spirochaetia bacterium]|nr:hypothetical protein AGMMS50267_14950 [Spirochaetia bacterium]
MKKLCIFGMVFLVFLGSCATSIPVTVTKPAIMNMRGIEKIAVVPFTIAYERSAGNYIDLIAAVFSKSASYNTVLEQQTAQALTGAVTDAILGTRAYTMIDSGMLSRLDQSQYATVVDAYMIGEVTLLKITDSDYSEPVKNADGTTGFKMMRRRIADLEFTYRLIRAADGSIISQIKKTGTCKDVSPDGRALRDEFDMVKEIISDELEYLNRDIAPWTIIEYRTLESEKPKSPNMKEAAALVKQRSYIQARDRFITIYEETGSFAAGYNAALVTEIAGDLQGGMERMAALSSATGNPKAAQELARMKRTQAEIDALLAEQEYARR